MCIPHGATGTKNNGFVKKSRVQKSIQKVSQDKFEKGDPDFKDERIEEQEVQKKKSFFDFLLS